MRLTPILNRKFALEERSLVPDGAGGFTEVWTNLGTVWASVDSRRGGERLVEGRTVSSVTYHIVLRAAPVGSASRPKPDQRFRDGTRIFTILAVSESDRHAQYLECQAEEGSLG